MGHTPSGSLHGYKIEGSQLISCRDTVGGIREYANSIKSMYGQNALTVRRAENLLSELEGKSDLESFSQASLPTSWNDFLPIRALVGAPYHGSRKEDRQFELFSLQEMRHSLSIPRNLATVRTTLRRFTRDTNLSELDREVDTAAKRISDTLFKWEFDLHQPGEASPEVSEESLSKVEWASLVQIWGLLRESDKNELEDRRDSAIWGKTLGKYPDIRSEFEMRCKEFGVDLDSAVSGGATNNSS